MSTRTGPPRQDERLRRDPAGIFGSAVAPRAIRPGGMNAAKSISLTGAATVAARGGGALIQLAVVPLIADTYGRQGLAEWFLIMTAYAFTQSLDLGIGCANIGLAATQAVHQRWLVLRHLVTTTAKLASALAALLACIALAASTTLPAGFTESYLDVKPALQASLLAAILIALASIPALVVSQIAMGVGKGHLLGLSQLSAQIILLGVVVVCTQAHAPFLSLVTGACLALAAPPMMLAWLLYKNLIPTAEAGRADDCSSDLKVTEILRRAFPFFLLQIGTNISYNIDALIVAKYVAVGAVAEYATVQKIFSIPGIVIAAYLNAMWPAYSQAYAKGDMQWVRDQFRKSLRYVILGALLAASLLFWGLPYIMATWTKNVVTVHSDVAMCFAIWTVLNALGGAQYALMNGIGAVSVQVKFMLMGTAINLLLSILLTQAYGLTGPIIGTIVSAAILYFINGLIIKACFKHAQG